MHIRTKYMPATARKTKKVSSLYKLGDSWIESVTPARAQQLIEGQRNNRKPSARVINAYCQDMKDDAWNESLLPIFVDEQGRMFDGQHRMFAVKRANVTLKFAFVVQDYDKAMMVLDNGRKRSFHDILSIKGIPLYSQIATAVRQYSLLGQYQGLVGTKHIDEPTTSQRWEVYKSISPKLWHEAGLYVFRQDIRNMKLNSSFSACFVAFSLIDRKLAKTFAESVASGENLSADSPIFALRKTATKLAMDETRKYSVRTKLMLVVKTWNAWIEGSSIKKFNLAGSDFPKINKPVD